MRLYKRCYDSEEYVRENHRDEYGNRRNHSYSHVAGDTPIDGRPIRAASRLLFIVRGSPGGDNRAALGGIEGHPGRRQAVHEQATARKTEPEALVLLFIGTRTGAYHGTGDAFYRFVRRI